MSSDYQGHSAQALDKAHSPSQPKQQRQRSSGGGGGRFLVWMVILGAIIYGLFIYLPAQFDDRYAGSGAVIGMVNPNGEDPGRDLEYSKVNQNNSEANLTNAVAEQRRSSVWIIFISILGIFGTIIVLFGMATK